MQQEADAWRGQGHGPAVEGSKAQPVRPRGGGDRGRRDGRVQRETEGHWINGWMATVLVRVAACRRARRRGCRHVCNHAVRHVCRHAGGHMCRHVCRRVCRHVCVWTCVWTHVCRHVGRHLCLPDDVHIGMNKDTCNVLWVYVCEHWVRCEVPSHRAARRRAIEDRRSVLRECF